MANNQFRERIILLNKEKICSSANALCNKFLRKTCKRVNLVAYTNTYEAGTVGIFSMNGRSLVTCR